MNELSVSQHHTPDGDVRWTDILVAVVRHRVLFVVITLAGLALATGVALRRPPEYKATAKLLVEPNVAHVPVTATENDTAVASVHADSRGTEAEINSTIAMLSSVSLVREVLRTHTARTPIERPDGRFARIVRFVREAINFPDRLYRKLHDVNETSDLERRVGHAMSGLRIQSVERANIIEIAFTHHDPEWAAEFVNALVSTYLDQDPRSDAENTRLEFFHDQRMLFENKLRLARQALRDFQAGPAADVPFDDEGGVREFRDELRRDKARAEVQLVGVRAELESLEDEYGKLEASIPVDPLVANVPSVDSVAARIADLELERSRLLSRYTPGSVVIRDIETDIANAKKILVRQQELAATALIRSGPASQQLAGQLVDARVEQDRISARILALTTEIDRCTAKLERLDELNAERTRLKAQLQSAETAYETYLTKEEEARFARDLQIAGIRNQVLVEKAIVPTTPEPPAVWRTITVGILLSLAAAILVVLGVDRLAADAGERADRRPVTDDARAASPATEIEERPALPVPRDDPLGPPAPGRPKLKLLAFGIVAAAGALATNVLVLGLPRSADSEAAFASASARSAPAALAVFERMPPSPADSIDTVGSAASLETVPERRRADLRATRHRSRSRSSTLDEPIVHPSVEPTVRSVASPTVEPATETAAVPVVQTAAATTAEPVVQAVTGSPAGPAARTNAERTATAKATEVVVLPGMTLYSLIREVYGECTPQLLESVSAANHDIDDPAHIVAGSTIRFPLLLD